jgi:2-phospho-L-lactate guanylyltransferase
VTAHPPAWVVLLALKPLSAAKTRLARPDRPALTLAMALDTVDAALAVGPDVVAAVLVVTNDPWASSALARVRPAAGSGRGRATGGDGDRIDGRDRVAVVRDLPDAGLNEALRHAARVAGRRWPGRGVAALSADLASLRPTQLHRALTAAPVDGRGVVADAPGTGTVLLTASPGIELGPAFGPDSRRAHTASGAVDLTARLGATVSGLRRDVDTVADLDVALRLGVGPATREVLDGRLPARAERAGLSGQARHP